MAGIGIELNKIFNKNTIVVDIFGFFYSTLITVAPMFLIIGEIIFMERFLGFDTVGYYARELFSCSVLYIFIFSILVGAPFNTVLSKYMSDVIYREEYDNILACYHIGLFLNLCFGSLLAIPFCIWEHFVGKVPLYYVCTGYFGFIALLLAFYSMIYLSICKDYKKISLYFLYGITEGIVQSWIMIKWFHLNITYSMLLSLSMGFFVTAIIETAQIKQYFREDSKKYREVFDYMKRYWKLMVANFLYIFGLYIHNFVFWGTDMRMTVAHTFVCNEPYDMATCLALFTNLSASVIFIAKVEMHFHERYRSYSEAVIGGRWMDIKNAKKRMFRQLSEELVGLVRTQFIVTVELYVLFMIFLPQFGFGGLVMKIYSCLAAGYFILFIMYAAIIFLYYFDDLNGALITSLSFCLSVFVFSLIATKLPVIWYGVGVFIGSFIGWSVAYARLHWIEKNFDTYIFCNGSILKQVQEAMPSSKVYDRKDVDGKKEGR